MTYARDVLRADGLTSIERSEREAAQDENRNEEAAIFERAASRLRPSWAGADEMLDLGLANAVPVPEVVVPPSFAAITSAPASFLAVAPSTLAPVSIGSARDAGYASSTEDTDGFATSSAKRGLASRLAEHKLALAAVACVVLGGAWAGLSGEAPKAPEAPAAVAAPVAPAAAAPVTAAPAPVVAAPTPAPALVAPTPAPAKSGELTRDEARALLGLPPEPAKTAAKKPAAKKPVAKAPIKAKAVAKKPVAKGPIPKNPFGATKKPAAKR